MVQKNEVLTREDNCIPLICRGRTALQEDYPTITERETRVNATEQTWVFEVGEKARAGRRIPKLGSFLVDIIKWLHHLGNGKIDDRLLESRHNTHHNVRTNDIRF